MALSIGKLFSRGGGGDDQGPGPVDLTTPVGRVNALIAEIGGSAQSRRITVSIGVAELVLDVAAKQLVRIISIKPEGLRYAKALSIDTRSYDNLDSQLVLFTQLFSEIGSFPGQFDMVSRPCPVTYPAKTQGFNADELKFAAWTYAPDTAELKSLRDSAEKLTAAAGGIAPPAAASAPVAAATPAPAPAPTPVAAEPPAPEPILEEPEPEAARQVDAPKAKKSPMRTAKMGAGTDTSFHDMISPYCDITVMLNHMGEVMICTENEPEWESLAQAMTNDMLRWIKNTSSILPEKQLIVMRSQLSQSQSVCFYLDGENITFAVISSVAIGRLFVAANEFVGAGR